MRWTNKEGENEDISARCPGEVHFQGYSLPLEWVTWDSMALVPPGAEWDFKCNPFQQVTAQWFRLVLTPSEQELSSLMEINLTFSRALNWS